MMRNLLALNFPIIRMVQVRSPLIERKVYDHPIFVVHNIEHALCVAEASERTETFVILASARDGACSLGPDVFMSIINKAAAQHPDARIEGLLDCAEDAGVALNAIRRGVPHISVDLQELTYKKIIDIANQSNTRVRKYPNSVIDLINDKNPTETISAHIMEYTQK